jgi:meso-butanediol dehydrogenase / (S,S)-butanediol dehydrogenase / diacetyl reductase
MARLDGRVAIVTGGGRGIGKGICQVLASEGATVVVADINSANAEATARELATTGATSLALVLDVALKASAEACIEQTVAAFGGLDILVNNAGVLGDHTGRDVTDEDWALAMNVNVKGIWLMSQAAVPAFRERGGGKIVNVASIAGRQGTGLHPHYSASKAAAINLTQSLALTLGHRNINVNAVCPGLVRTDMWQNLEKMMRAPADQPSPVDLTIANNMPLRREQTPEDIGKAVAFFASDDARNITGQSLNIDGGMRLN